MTRRRFTTIASIALMTAVVGLFAIAPLTAYAAVTCDLAPAVPLEVGIGAVSSVTSLSNYISQAYQFIVSSIGIVAAVMIMFNGMRWVTAGGNSENVNVARGGISSAIIGLLIAVTSYVLLYAVNSSLVNLVDICPEGLDFSNSTASTSWSTCPGQNASECSTVSYCLYDGGCECANIGSGDGQAYVCRPKGTNVLPSGSACQSDDNCVSPLKCVGNTGTNPGTCTESDSGTTCSVDADCDAGLTCEKITSTIGQCLEPTGRSNGTTCDEASQCESGVCNDTLGVNHCVAGDETTTDRCVGDTDCAPSYSCSSSTERCVAKAEGSSCEQYDRECGDGLHCVENDGAPGFATCMDGSEGDDCDANNECDSGFCGQNVCTDGTEDKTCDDDSDCAASYHCDYTGINECTHD